MQKHARVGECDWGGTLALFEHLNTFLELFFGN